MVVDQIVAEEIMPGDVVWAHDDGAWLKVYRVEDDGDERYHPREITVFRLDGSEATFRAGGNVLRRQINGVVTR